MNREIKFRAWDKRMGRMLSDATPMRGSIWWNDGACFDSCGKEYDVMQFTGLLDKDGKEIYEGDILEEEKGYLFEVVWDGELAKFRLQWRTKAIQYPEWNRGNKMRVVGNIHENSGLLSG